ncbi:sigma-54-dependent Fis family transcriptional regulator [candidate division KSB1 bacterium]|nr:sigma-54-dependent Fis family transcriptional regulator [candidate division KSB1 bacterium]
MTKVASILAVDDEADFVDSLSSILTKHEYSVDTSCSGYEALQMLSIRPYDLVLLDLTMPLISGIDTLKRIQRIDPGLPVIILTGDSRVGTVVDAMKLGAYDFFPKPLDWERLEIAIKNALITKELRGEVSRLQGQLKSKYSFKQIIGNSKSMQDVFRSLERVVEANVTVSIRGESGTGKELLARSIHFNGLRKQKAFVAVNCAAIPESLLESELFGHEKGAFTGAIARRAGKFEQADGGTLFLDEIGDMPHSTQVKILRVLQERQFQRVGGTETVEVDVRVISATNKNLEEEMKKGNFREDLYYRINVYPIFVPPLRKRREDIPALAAFFLGKYNKEYRRKVKAILPQTLDYLMNYEWPGNVRELENILERSFLHASDGVLAAEHLPITITSFKEDLNSGDSFINLKKVVSLTRQITPLKDLEKEVLQQAIKLTNYNMSNAALELGIGRTTLYRKLEKYGITLRR